MCLVMQDLFGGGTDESQVKGNHEKGELGCLHVLVEVSLN